jgi:hypothetical protein
MSSKSPSFSRDVAGMGRTDIKEDLISNFRALLNNNDESLWVRSGNVNRNREC